MEIWKGRIRQSASPVRRAAAHNLPLLTILAERIADEDFLNLLHHVVGSFETSPNKGLPLGNLTSQLFANIYMNELDQFVKRFLHVPFYIRYADDFVFLSHNRTHLVSLLPLIQSFLQGRLQLTLHPNKVHLQTIASGTDFLGWVHFPHHRVPRTVTRRRMLSHIRECPEGATLQSYLGMLQHGDAWELSERACNEVWVWGAP